MTFSKKNFAAIFILTALAVLIFTGQKTPGSTKTETKTKPHISETDAPQIVSTNPDPLEDTIVSATQIIEISFNRPLQNSGEFKLRIEPKIDFKIDLSSDRKTAKISFTKPLELGVTYTIFIGPDTKFDGTSNWGQEKIYHFKTVKYTGV